jgi:hypothetical protein
VTTPGTTPGILAGSALRSDRREAGAMVADWNLGSVLWAMLVFFFWFIFIWMFIGVFADIFRRNDIGGGAKAGWVILIVFLPFLGILIYLIARPKMTEQDRETMQGYAEAQRRASGYSAADEIVKAQQLKDSGAISEEEFQEMKRRALS